MSGIFSSEFREMTERNELVEITKFIAQEAYRLAVIKQYPEEYSRIVNLYKTVELKLSKYYNYSFLEVDYLVDRVVDHIVFGSEIDIFTQNITTILNQDESLNGIYDDVSFLSEIYDSVIGVFNENLGFKCNLVHKYPPHVLGMSFDYHVVLEYFYNRVFIPTQERVKTEHGMKIIITSAPYTSAKQYVKRTIDEVSYKSKEVSVSSDALSQKQDEKRTIKDGPDVFESWFTLSFLEVKSAVDMITELNFKLDMSDNISNEELDRILTVLRWKISNAQLSNRNERMLLAETQVDLISAYRTPELTKMDFTSFVEINKVSLPGLDSEENAKDFLCGLVLMSAHFVRVEKVRGLESVRWKANADGNSILWRRGELANKWLEKYGGPNLNAENIEDEQYIDYGGFSPSMIERGYKKLKKVMQGHIDDFQYNRIQFDKRLNTTQRQKLSLEEDVRLDRLHLEDRDRAEIEIEKHVKQGRAATVKPWGNGSFVISW